ETHPGPLHRGFCAATRLLGGGPAPKKGTLQIPVFPYGNPCSGPFGTAPIGPFVGRGPDRGAAFPDRPCKTLPDHPREPQGDVRPGPRPAPFGFGRGGPQDRTL